MRHWTILVVGVLALGIVTAAVLTRYDYRGDFSLRVDRWTGKVQYWQCRPGPLPIEQYVPGYSPGRHIPEKLRHLQPGECVWTERYPVAQ